MSEYTPYFEGDGPKEGECSDCGWFDRKGSSEFGVCLRIHPIHPIHPGPLVADDFWCDWFTSSE
jgi:hypothetical protein